MIDLYPHITFNGDCQQAMHFYQQCFNGLILSCIKYGEATDIETTPEYADKIMFCEFACQGLVFRASDAPPNISAPQKAGNVSLNLEFDDAQELLIIYQHLSSEGTIIVPINPVAINNGAYTKSEEAKHLFAIICDKFGVIWMLKNL